MWILVLVHELNNTIDVWSHVIQRIRVSTDKTNQTPYIFTGKVVYTPQCVNRFHHQHQLRIVSVAYKYSFHLSRINISKEMNCNNPSWNMERPISVDSNSQICYTLKRKSIYIINLTKRLPLWFLCRQEFVKQGLKVEPMQQWQPFCISTLYHVHCIYIQCTE